MSEREKVNLNGLAFEREGEMFFIQRNAQEIYELYIDTWRDAPDNTPKEIWVGRCDHTNEGYVTPDGNLGTAVDWVAEQLFKGSIAYETGKLSINKLDLEPTSDPRVFTLSALRRRYDLEITDRPAPMPSVDVTRHELDNNAGFSYNTIAEAIRLIKKEIWGTRLTVYYHMGGLSLDLNYGEASYVVDEACGREYENVPHLKNIKFYDALGSPELERLDQLNREQEGELSDEDAQAHYVAWCKAISVSMLKHNVDHYYDTESGDDLIDADEWREKRADELA